MGRLTVAGAGAGAVLALLLGSSHAAAADSLAVRAGKSLRATVQADPWRIVLRGPRGRAVLSESSAAGSGPSGPLGLRTAGGWSHATHATRLERVGPAITATVATDDPLGGTLDVTIAAAGRGVIELDAEVSRAGGAEATGIGFGAGANERFFGFGERSNAVDFRGLDVENWTSDGAVREEDRQYPKPFLPPWVPSDRDDATYFPIPWLLSSQGYGVLIDNSERSFFRLGSERAGEWSLEAEAANLGVRFFAGPRPAKALKRFTRDTGRQPAARAPWFYGPWFQTGQPNQIPLEVEREATLALRNADAPVSAAETQMHYLPCGAHRGAETQAYLDQRNQFFHSQGLAHLAYMNPLLCASYQPVYGNAAGAGLLQQLPAGGSPYLYNGFVGGAAPAGFSVEPLSQFDFTAPGTKDFYAGLLDELVADGHDGFMEDFGEWTPPDSISADGTTGAEMHNLYPTTFHCAVYDIARDQPRPLVRFQRSGWTGSAPCADNVWGGDNTTVWDYDGLTSAVKEGLSMGLSGISRWGSDIGGYNSYGPAERLDEELLARWIEFGAVSAVMRTKGGGLAFPSYDRPQVWEQPTLPIWRRYAKLHTQLNPYLHGADRIHRRTGLPVMRHLALVAPRDEAALAREDEFMFGPSLLAAPVTDPGAESKNVYLPRGRWIDFWRSVTYRESDGGFYAGAARILRGGREVELPAPLEELPLLVRAGSVIPMLPPEVDTLAEYGDDDPDLVTLADRAGRLRLLAFPRGRIRAPLGERGSLVSAETRAGWNLRLRGAPTSYTLDASLGSLRKRLVPCSVALNGREVPASSWDYRPDGRLLSVRFRTAGASRLAVRGC